MVASQAHSVLHQPACLPGPQVPSLLPGLQPGPKSPLCYLVYGRAPCPLSTTQSTAGPHFLVPSLQPVPFLLPGVYSRAPSPLSANRSTAGPRVPFHVGSLPGLGESSQINRHGNHMAPHIEPEKHTLNDVKK
ncbi:hypothetical protein NHX12_026712 [Muraenolepis orangiensis]|uniref:Uncharacterized protein n=1 Tax=Muraenolepis orangiensis TaxID=630683 RepID=A0A9Q0EHX6_9TELE|nr:hypothetical protein NHX12_026712 [Muraenolepis orangiensis]